MKKVKIFGLIVALLVSGIALAQWNASFEYAYKSIALKSFQSLLFGNTIRDAIGISDEQTNDALFIGVNPTARALHIADFGDVNFNFANAAFSNPSLVIHSANQATDEWVRIYHDGTSPYIDSGKGALGFPDGILTNSIYTETNVIFEGSSADANETTLAVANPNADQTITLPNATGFVAVGGNVSVPQVPNQDCNTTCGTATKCMFGQDSDAAGILRACNSATSDVCVCVAQ